MATSGHGPEPRGKPCAMASSNIVLAADFERFHHEVLEDSMRNGIDTHNDRDGLLSLSFLKIVVNSMLSKYN